MRSDELKTQLRTITRGQRTPATLKRVAVPGVEGAFVYFWPSMTLAERNAITKAGEERGVFAGAAMAVIVRARDEEGRRVWQDAELDKVLEDYPAETILQLGAEMTRASESAPTLEAAEKN
jgi:hypothetical protein